MSKASEELKKRVALLRGITRGSRGGGKEPSGTESIKDSATNADRSTSPKNRRPSVQ